MEETLNTPMDQDVRYDESVKVFLSQTTVLVWILSAVIPEFSGMSFDDIADCIVGKPEVSKIPINPGETNRHITGETQENAVRGEGKITYDIRFRVVAPNGDEVIELLINIEPQGNFYPGYHIETRGIFYLARMISAQKTTEFDKSDYDLIKKCYSIFICMDSPKKTGNAISLYSMQKQDLYGNIPNRKRAYDKMALVMVMLNEDSQTDNEFLDKLNISLSAKLDENEKIQTLYNKYGVVFQNEEKEALTHMTALSAGVLKQGIAQGRSEGVSTLATVINFLFTNNKEEEAKEVAADPQKMDAVIKKYGIQI